MKIALVGSAPSSVRLAPFRDPSWTVWACSPGTYPIVEMEGAAAFFELHRWEPPVIGRPDQQVPWFSPEYCAWLAKFKGPVYTTEVIPDIKNSTRLPREMLIEKYGPYFWSSSLAWMLALALEQPGIQEIGLWGVDMSAVEEYRYQRPGCHHFLTIAMERGIKVTIPPESDLLQPMPLYGVDEWNPFAVKLLARQRELTARLQSAVQREAQAHEEAVFLRGAMDDLKYMQDTWTSTRELDRILERMASAAPARAPVVQIRGDHGD
jgi:hypothetical protein